MDKLADPAVVALPILPSGAAGNLPRVQTRPRGCAEPSVSRGTLGKNRMQMARCRALFLLSGLRRSGQATHTHK